MPTYTENAVKAEAELKPFLTDDFLQTLQLAARTFGWSGDFTEVRDFVNWCRDVADKESVKFDVINYFEGSE